MIDVPEKTVGDKSNAVAGYYISSTRRHRAGPRSPRRAMSSPRPGNEPLPSQMPQQAPISPARPTSPRRRDIVRLAGARLRSRVMERGTSKSAPRM